MAPQEQANRILGKVAKKVAQRAQKTESSRPLSNLLQVPKTNSPIKSGAISAIHA